MSDSTTERDRDDAELLLSETSDEALEAAACSRGCAVAAYTVAMCTGLVECPF